MNKFMEMSFGNESKVLVKGKHKILIRLKDGGHQFISPFYYVPNMKKNSLSLRRLLEKGYDIHMKDLSLSIKKMEKIIDHKGTNVEG